MHKSFIFLVVLVFSLFLISFNDFAQAAYHGDCLLVGSQTCEGNDGTDENGQAIDKAQCKDTSGAVGTCQYDELSSEKCQCTVPQ